MRAFSTWRRLAGAGLGKGSEMTTTGVKKGR
jgi:hypothetical protein